MKRYKSIFEDQLPGGLGDDRPDEMFDSKQLRMGIEVEYKHTGNYELVKEIVKDHLIEHPEYYTHLKDIEDKLEVE